MRAHALSRIVLQPRRQVDGLRKTRMSSFQSPVVARKQEGVPFQACGQAHIRHVHYSEETRRDRFRRNWNEVLLVRISKHLTPQHQPPRIPACIRESAFTFRSANTQLSFCSPKQALYLIALTKHTANESARFSIFSCGTPQFGQPASHLSLSTSKA